MDIGERIKIRREKLGISQEELAKRVGYTSKTTISKIEGNANCLRQTKIAEFAKALDVTPAYLMGWEPAVADAFTTTSPRLVADVMLDADLKRLVDMYNKLSDADRKALVKLAEFLLNKEKDESV